MNALKRFKIAWICPKKCVLHLELVFRVGCPWLSCLGCPWLSPVSLVNLNLSNFSLVVKKWDSLDGFEVYWVYTTQKNHETHVSFVSDFILSHYCITDRWFRSNCSNLKIFLLVEKKGDYLYFFEVSEVQVCQKSHDPHASHVSDLILSHY